MDIRKCIVNIQLQTVYLTKEKLHPFSILTMEDILKLMSSIYNDILITITIEKINSLKNMNILKTKKKLSNNNYTKKIIKIM